MKAMKRLLAVTALAALVAASAGPGVMAQTGGGYDLSWNNTDGGLATSSGGGYQLAGAAGQHDAGSMSGGAYSLNTGFFTPVVYRAMVPIVRKP